MENPTAHSEFPEKDLLEKLKIENDNLRKERRSLLLALFPPQSEADFHQEEYKPYSWPELLAEITKDS